MIGQTPADLFPSFIIKRFGSRIEFVSYGEVGFD
jgi:hypothetical protein